MFKIEILSVLEGQRWCQWQRLTVNVKSGMVWSHREYTGDNDGHSDIVDYMSDLPLLLSLYCQLIDRPQ